MKSLVPENNIYRQGLGLYSQWAIFLHSFPHPKTMFMLTPTGTLSMLQSFANRTTFVLYDPRRHVFEYVRSSRTSRRTRGNRDFIHGAYGHDKICRWTTWDSQNADILPHHLENKTFKTYLTSYWQLVAQSYYLHRSTSTTCAGCCAPMAC